MYVCHFRYYTNVILWPVTNNDDQKCESLSHIIPRAMLVLSKINEYVDFAHRKKNSIRSTQSGLPYNESNCSQINKRYCKQEMVNEEKQCRISFCILFDVVQFCISITCIKHKHDAVVFIQLITRQSNIRFTKSTLSIKIHNKVYFHLCTA